MARIGPEFTKELVRGPAAVPFPVTGGIGVGVGVGVGVPAVIFIVPTLYRLLSIFVTPFPGFSAMFCHGFPHESPTKISYFPGGIVLGIVIVRVSTAFPDQ